MNFFQRSVDQRSLLIGLSLVPAGAIVGLLLILVWISFRFEGQDGTTYGIQAYISLYADPFVTRTLLNTALFSLVTVATALFFGVPAAWLVERTDLPHKELPFTLMTMGLLIPGFLSAMGWVFLLHPRIGLLNVALGSVTGMSWRINIATPLGMGFVEGIALAPLAFIMVAATFRSTNPELEEAASVHGMSLLRSLLQVTLPVMLPGILAAGIYILTIGIAAFEVPAVIGLSNRVFTFSTFLYLQVNPPQGLPRYDLAAAFGVFMAVIAGLLSWWYFHVLRQGHRYAVVTGRAYRPKLIELGPRGFLFAWGFLGCYFLLGQVLPLLTLVWSSLLRYFQLPSASALAQASLSNYRALPWPYLLSGLWNTAILMLVVPALVLLLSLAIAWVVVRSGAPGRFVLDGIAFLPHAVPNIIFALSAAYASLFLLPGFLPIYGTVFLLLAIYVLVRISFGTRVLNSALAQIHRELEEAGQVMGIPLLRRIGCILLPLLRPALVNAWLWMALLTYRELTVASLLVTPANVTLPMVIWGLWLNGTFSQAAAGATTGLLLMLPLVFVYWFLSRRATLGGWQT
jgi:iron(III) transport system permease protein